MDLEGGEQVQLQILIITQQFQEIMQNIKVSLTIAREHKVLIKQHKHVSRQAQYNVRKCKETSNHKQRVKVRNNRNSGRLGCMSMFTSLEGSQSPLERWMLPRRHTNATKAHPILPLRQHHEGVSQPLVVDLGVVSKPSQTFPRVITKFDSSPNDSYRLGVSNLQE